MVDDRLHAQLLRQADPDELVDELIADDTTLRLLEDVVRRARSRFATVEGAEPTLDPTPSTNRIVEELSWAGFTPNWLLSYHYEGEVANLVRFHYDPAGHPELPWRQLHVRLLRDGRLTAHEEASALMHKRAHLAEETFNLEYGTREVARILEEAGVEVQRLV